MQKVLFDRISIAIKLAFLYQNCETKGREKQKRDKIYDTVILTSIFLKITVQITNISPFAVYFKVLN